MSWRSRSTAMLLLLLMTSGASAAVRRRPVKSPDGPCRVHGLANLFYSTDGGTTWSGNAEPPSAIGVWDIAVLPSTPETLVTVAGHDVYDSRDDGCSWSRRYTITEEIHHTLHIVAATQQRAFLWTEEFVLRYDDGAVVMLTLPERIGGLGVDPGNHDHVRILGVDVGRAWESFDGGATWKAMGGAAGGAINSAAFDPFDFNHILAGVQTKGIIATRDGGKTWSTTAATSRFVCAMEFAAGRPDVLWSTLGSQGGQLTVQRSTNAGASPETIAGVPGVPQGGCLPVMTNPHDVNSAVVAFGVFYLVDATTRTATPASCCGGRMVRIAYSRKDPTRVYVSAPLR